MAKFFAILDCTQMANAVQSHMAQLQLNLGSVGKMGSRCIFSIKQMCL